MMLAYAIDTRTFPEYFNGRDTKHPQVQETISKAPVLQTE